MARDDCLVVETRYFVIVESFLNVVNVALVSKRVSEGGYDLEFRNKKLSKTVQRV